MFDKRFNETVRSDVASINIPRFTEKEAFRKRRWYLIDRTIESTKDREDPKSDKGKRAPEYLFIRCSLKLRKSTVRF